MPISPPFYSATPKAAELAILKNYNHQIEPFYVLSLILVPNLPKTLLASQIETKTLWTLTTNSKIKHRRRGIRACHQRVLIPLNRSYIMATKLEQGEEENIAHQPTESRFTLVTDEGWSWWNRRMKKTRRWIKVCFKIISPCELPFLLLLLWAWFVLLLLLLNTRVRE